MYIYVYVLPGTNARDVILYVGKPKLQREAGQSTLIVVMKAKE